MKETTIRFLDIIKQSGDILVYIKGSPDPDALASAYALTVICRKLGTGTVIAAQKKVSLPQNEVLIREIGIPVHFEYDLRDAKKFSSYVIVDHQSVQVDTLTGVIPCSMHLDHHEDIGENIPVAYRYVSENAGSTSTIIALLLQDMDLDFSADEMGKMATALLYGIQTDTDRFAHANEQDYIALHYLSGHANNDIIKKITDVPMSRETIKLLWEAIANVYVYKNWIVTGVGYIGNDRRDSIAIIADFLIRREKADVVVVYAAVEDQKRHSLFLDASFRADDEGMNLNDIIRRITQEGGARKYKGAFQINMDFFSRCPDRKLLWDLIHMTMVEVVKEQRDSLYRTELKGIFERMKRRFQDIFEKK
jgi:nanoRNase/pAp phosphatase (c-di-AMP/oligoRNAs hydrolase)